MATLFPPPGPNAPLAVVESFATNDILRTGVVAGLVVGGSVAFLLIACIYWRFRKAAQGLAEELAFNVKLAAASGEYTLGAPVTKADAAVSTPQQWMDAPAPRGNGSEYGYGSPRQAAAATPSPQEIVARNPLAFLGASFGLRAPSLSRELEEKDQRAQDRRRTDPSAPVWV